MGAAVTPCHRARMTKLRPWGVLALLATLAGCPDDEPAEPAWAVVASGLDEAVLSIAGTAADDVWAVGADQGAGPLVVHYDGVAWTRMATGHTGNLWWAHAFAPDDVFFGGASGAILRWDGTTFTRMCCLKSRAKPVWVEDRVDGDIVIGNSPHVHPRGK